MSRDAHMQDAGAYVLSALEPAEQAAFEGHLASCADCRAEVERLRAAVDALPRSVEPFAAPLSLKRSLMEAVRDDAAGESAPARRRSLLERLGLDRPLTGMRPEFAWVSAAFVLAVGIALGAAVSQLSGGSGSSPQRVVAAVADRTRVPNASATLTLPAGSGSGPSQLRVSGLPAPKPNQVYEIWLKRGDQLQPGPLFNVDSQGNGAGAIPGDLSGVSAVLVTREPTGGAQRPSEVPIISAKI